MNSVHLEGWFLGLAIYSDHLDGWLSNASLSRPYPQRFWCNWFGVGRPGRHPSFQKLPRRFTCAAQAENHWSGVRSWHLQIFKSSTGNFDLKPGLRTTTYTSCCLSLGFINGKALLSKNNSVNKYGRAYPCTAVYPFGVHSRKNNGACCRLISNL